MSRASSSTPRRWRARSHDPSGCLIVSNEHHTERFAPESATGDFELPPLRRAQLDQAGGRAARLLEGARAQDAPGARSCAGAPLSLAPNSNVSHLAYSATVLPPPSLLTRGAAFALHLQAPAAKPAAKSVEKKEPEKKKPLFPASTVREGENQPAPFGTLRAPKNAFQRLTCLTSMAQISVPSLAQGSAAVAKPARENPEVSAAAAPDVSALPALAAAASGKAEEPEKKKGFPIGVRSLSLPRVAVYATVL